jgi:hypothetical protein
MPNLRVQQLRSGEGSILTHFDSLGPECLADELSDLLEGFLVISSEAFESWTPPGGEQLEALVYAFTGDAARAMLRDHRRWDRERALFAVVPVLPDEDAKRRCMPHALRPWDAERLNAVVYGQYGSRYAHRGLWFANDEDRRRLDEVAITRLLEKAGLTLPNGDITLVLELPTDATFDATYRASGKGEGFRLRRDFPLRALRKSWWIVRGEWRGEEASLGRRSGQAFSERLARSIASGAILLLSLPVFLLVGAVALFSRLTGSGTPTSESARR